MKKDTGNRWTQARSPLPVIPAFFKGNDLFIDSSYSADSVTVRAVLKSNPSIWKETTIHIRKRPFTEPLKTNEEILEEMKIKRKKKN